MVIAAIVMPLVLFWFVKSAANDLHPDQAMREQADPSSRVISCCGRTVAGHSICRQHFRLSIRRSMGDMPMRCSTAPEGFCSPPSRSCRRYFPQDLRSSDIAFMESGKGTSAMSGVSLRKDMAGRTVWVEAGEDLRTVM